MSTLHPEVLWAQRSSEFDEDKNILFVTINLPDIIPDSLDYKLEPTKISFKARAGDSKKGIEEKDYAFSFDLFKEVVPEKSIQRLNSRSLALTLRKAEKELEYWPRLTKEKIRSQFLKTDFSKWVDEDEQDAAPVVEEEPDPMADLGMGGMPGMPGGMPPGMPGMPGLGGDMDIQKMLAQMGGGANFGGAGPSGAGLEDDDDSDSDDEGPPPLEDAAPPKP